MQSAPTSGIQDRKAEGWLALQTAFDLAEARKKAGSIAVRRYSQEPVGAK